MKFSLIFGSNEMGLSAEIIFELALALLCKFSRLFYGGVRSGRHGAKRHKNCVVQEEPRFHMRLLFEWASNRLARR